MEDFTFNDLNIKLGFPYLYCHQGDCEHVVVITDIRYVASLGEYFILKSAINWGERRTHATCRSVKVSTTRSLLSFSLVRGALGIELVIKLRS